MWSCSLCCYGQWRILYLIIKPLITLMFCHIRIYTCIYILFLNYIYIYYLALLTLSLIHCTAIDYSVVKYTVLNLNVLHSITHWNYAITYKCKRYTHIIVQSSTIVLLKKYSWLSLVPIIVHVHVHVYINWIKSGTVYK